MNCIYRIIWNAAIGKWVVASELASGRRLARRGGALAVVGLALLSSTALARDISEQLCDQTQDGTLCVARSDSATAWGIQADSDATYFAVSAGANPAAASTNGVNMIAIGSNARSNPASNGANNGAVTLGANANGRGSNALAIGYNSAADSDSFSGTSGATAIGATSRATWNSTAVGFQANANGTVVTSLGVAASATGERGVALGRGAQASGRYSTAVGNGAQATHSNSVAIGEGSVSRGNDTVAVGSTTRRRQIVNMADGLADNDAITVQQLGGALGALGGGATLDGAGTVVGPVYTLVNGGAQTTVGDALSALDGRVSTVDARIDNVTTRFGAGMLGLVQQAAGGDDLRVGAQQDGAAVRFTGSTGVRALRGVSAGTADADVITLAQLKGTAQSAADALGGGASATAGGTVDAPSYAIDGTAHATLGDALQALDGRVTGQRDAVDDLKRDGATQQRYFQANGTGADAAEVRGILGVAMGSKAAAGADRSVAIGADASAAGEQSVALGAGATASGASAVALGAGATAARSQVLSVGNDTLQRQIVNVAAGTEATDAVTLGQLQGTLAALGGGAHVDAVTGQVTGPQYDMQGRRYTDAGSALGAADVSLVAIDGRVTVNGQDIVDLQRQLGQWSDGQAGLVQQAGAQAAITVAANRAGRAVDVTGTEGPRQLKGLADGTGANDVVTLGQMDTALQAAQPEAARYLKVNGAADGSDDASAQGDAAMALGAAAQAEARGATALGHGARATAGNSIALGASAAAERDNAVSVGSAGAERQVVHVADASADTDGVNLRQLKNAGLVGGAGAAQDGITYTAGSLRGSVMFGGAHGTLLGNVADGRIAGGSREAVNGGQLAALREQFDGQLGGLDERIGQLQGPGQGGGSGEEGTAPPYYDARTGSVFVGDGAAADATGEGAVAAGTGAQAEAEYAVALGAGSVADRDDTVAVGSSGNERQLTHVAAGLYESDAVNVGQLREAMADVNSYTDQRVEAMVDSMEGEMGHMQRQVNRGIAAAAALVQVTPNLPGKVTLNAGVATYRGESAFGVGLSRWSRSGRYNLNAGVSAARGDQPLFNVGFGIAFD